MICHVEFRNGATLVESVSVDDAGRWALATWGTDSGPYRVRVATDADRAWVEAMGGATHETQAAFRRNMRKQTAVESR